MTPAGKRSLLLCCQIQLNCSSAILAQRLHIALHNNGGVHEIYYRSD